MTPLARDPLLHVSNPTRLLTNNVEIVNILKPSMAIAAQIELSLPLRLNYEGNRDFFSENFDSLMTKCNATILINWGEVRWVELPEAMQILALSCRLIEFKNEVTWDLSFRRVEDVDTLKAFAEQQLSRPVFQRISRHLNGMMELMRNNTVHPSLRKKIIDQIRKELPYQEPARFPWLNPWLDAEFERLDYMNVIGYLVRYRYFHAARARKIQTAPREDTVAYTQYSTSRDTAALAIHQISGVQDVYQLQESLTSEIELSRIFGDYAHLDVARRGVLSNVLVAELGRNIAEHAPGSSGWVCSRRLMGTGDASSGGDTIITRVEKSGLPYLEVIVSDTGPGLTHGLGEILSRDNRVQIKEKYSKASDGHYRDIDLVDYAFDRLSSTKRDIAALLHYSETRADSGVSVSSGLYWVWNAARSYGGFLWIRTGAIAAYYDFSIMRPNQARGAYLLQKEKGYTPWCGTEIRLYLPLVAREWAPTIHFARKTEGSFNLGKDAPPNFQFEWLGEYTTGPRRRNIEASRSRISEKEQLELGLPETSSIAILTRLKRAYDRMQRDTVLALDLTGIRSRWLKDNIYPIVYFFTEMNFVATSGVSSVILWNVPLNAIEVIERAYAIVREERPHLGHWLRLPLMLTEDRSALVFSDNQKVGAVIQMLSREGSLAVTDVVRESEMREREQLLELVHENQHLLRFDPVQDTVAIRTWWHTIAEAARRKNIEWLNRVTDTPVRNGGALWHRTNTLFRLPSTGYLVDQYYGYSRLLSRFEASMRIAWLFADRVIDLVQRDGPIDYIISVTRVTERMIAVVAAIVSHVTKRDVGCLTATTVAALQETCSRQLVKGRTVFLTDVVSSGTLVYQVSRVAEGLHVLGTICLLDTRVRAISNPAVEEQIRHDSASEASQAEVGPIDAFVARETTKLDPQDIGDQIVVSVDKVNVCPIMPPVAPRGGLQESLLSLSDVPGEAIRLGHLTFGHQRHYSCYVDPVALVNVRSSIHGDRTLKEVVVERILRTLEEGHYDPNSTVLVHPPLDNSRIRGVVELMEDETGAAYRVVMHEDTFSVQARYATYLDHGIDTENGTVVIVDDGANSGNTLLAMLNVACRYRPKLIVAVVMVSRLPVFMSELLAQKLSFGPPQTRIHIFQGIWLGIPVYSSVNCPLCDMVHGLRRLAVSNTLLSQYASELVEVYEARDVLKEIPGGGELVTLEGVDRARYVMIREEMELSGLRQRFSPVTEDLISSAASIGHDIQCASELVAVIFLEPDLIRSPLLRPWLDYLFASFISHAMVCEKAERLRLLFGAFLCLVQMDEYFWDEKMAASYRNFAEHVYDIDVQSGGETGVLHFDVACSITLILGWCLKRGQGDGKEWAIMKNVVGALRATAARRHPGTLRELTWTILEQVVAKLLAYKDGLRGAKEPITEGGDLFALARRAAGYLWQHAPMGLASRFEELDELVGDAYTAKAKEVVHQHLQAYLAIESLRGKLRSIQEQIARKTTENEWLSLYMLDDKMDELVTDYYRWIGNTDRCCRDGLSEGKVGVGLAGLQTAYSRLCVEGDRCFQDIFPRVGELARSAWAFCEKVSTLPASCVQPVTGFGEKDDERVFMPGAVLKQFITACMENFRPRAFCGVGDEEVESGARVGMELSGVEQEGARYLEVAIWDNGPQLRVGSVLSGHNAALKNRVEMMKAFGAELRLPERRGEWTYVSVRMMPLNH